MDPGSAAHHAAKSGALRSIRGTALYATATKGGSVGRSRSARPNATPIRQAETLRQGEQ
jgi:hypothetical protein